MPFECGGPSARTKIRTKYSGLGKPTRGLEWRTRLDCRLAAKELQLKKLEMLRKSIRRLARDVYWQPMWKSKGRSVSSSLSTRLSGLAASTGHQMSAICTLYMNGGKLRPRTSDTPDLRGLQSRIAPLFAKMRGSEETLHVPQQLEPAKCKVYTCLSIYLSVCLSVYLHFYLCPRLYHCIHVCLCMCTYTSIHVCIYPCACVSLYLSIHLSRDIFLSLSLALRPSSLPLPSRAAPHQHRAMPMRPARHMKG